MADKIKVTGFRDRRIVDTSPTPARVEPADVAHALGGDMLNTQLSADQGPISLGAVGNALIQRLRSTGGRPALAGVTQKQKISLSDDEVSMLEKLTAILGQRIGLRPSIGQVASVLLSASLTTLVQQTNGLQNMTAQQITELAASVGQKVDELV